MAAIQDVGEFEDGIQEGAEAELGDQFLNITTDFSVGSSAAIGNVSVTIEVTTDAPDELGEVLMEQAYTRFVGESDNVVSQAIQASHERLSSYGSAHDYSTDSIEESLEGVQTSQGDNSLTIQYGWSHPASAFFEQGVSPHTIEGNPILSFVWSDPPDWVKEEFDQARGGSGQFTSGWRVFLPSVDHPGIPESRFARAGIDHLRREAT